MWDEGLLKMGNTSCEEISFSLVDFLQENEFDKIILTQFENWQGEDVHDYTGLSNFVDQWEEYGYGWEKDMFQNESEYCEGGSHSEVVYTPEWMKSLSGEVYICGAFDGECIEDLEIGLDHCVGGYKRLNQFIV